MSMRKTPLLQSTPPNNFLTLKVRGDRSANEVSRVRAAGRRSALMAGGPDHRQFEPIRVSTVLGRSWSRNGTASTAPLSKLPVLAFRRSVASPMRHDARRFWFAANAHVQSAVVCQARRAPTLNMSTIGRFEWIPVFSLELPAKPCSIGSNQ